MSEPSETTTLSESIAKLVITIHEQNRKKLVGRLLAGQALEKWRTISSLVFVLALVGTIYFDDTVWEYVCSSFMLLSISCDFFLLFVRKRHIGKLDVDLKNDGVGISVYAKSDEFKQALDEMFESTKPEGQTFQLTKKQCDEIDEWKKGIKETHGKYGEYEIRFRQTGIGLNIGVFSKLANTELDVTDYDSW